MRRVGDVQEDQVGNVSEHDTEGRPHLPHHDQSTTDWSRGAFCGIDGHSRRFWADTKAEDETSGEQMWPGVGDARPNASEEGESGRDEYRAAATKHFVKRIREPAAKNGAA